MRANTPTLLPLDQFSEIIGMHPFYANQFGTNIPARSRGQCQSVLYQDIWQDSDNISREEIAQAIALAEQRFFELAGYWPAPKYITTERHDYPKYYDKRYVNSYTQPDWRYKSVKAKSGYIQSVGTETLTAVDLSVAITAQDYDNDGFDEAFSATVAVAAGTDPSTIAVFFTSADRPPDALLANWEIRPVSVSVTGAVATIIGGLYLLTLPNLELEYDPQPLDAVDVANYVTQVEVYYRTTDTSDTGSLIWERVLEGCFDGTSPCDVVVDTACWIARDKDSGWLAPVPAQWDADTSTFAASCPTICYRPPDRVTLNYLAGYPRQANGKMDNTLAKIVSLIAVNYLPNRKCGCDRVDVRLEFWRQYPSDGQGNVFITPEQANNPLGSSRGLIEAWNLLYPIIQYQGAAVF